MNYVYIVGPNQEKPFLPTYSPTFVTQILFYPTKALTSSNQSIDFRTLSLLTL